MLAAACCCSTILSSSSRSQCLAAPSSHRSEAVRCEAERMAAAKAQAEAGARAAEAAWLSQPRHVYVDSQVGEQSWGQLFSCS